MKIACCGSRIPSTWQSRNIGELLCESKNELDRTLALVIVTLMKGALVLVVAESENDGVGEERLDHGVWRSRVETILVALIAKLVVSANNDGCLMAQPT